MERLPKRGRCASDPALRRLGRGRLHPVVQGLGQSPWDKEPLAAISNAAIAQKEHSLLVIADPQYVARAETT